MKPICEIKPEDLNCSIFSSYDYDGYSIQDLLNQFYTKINECVEISNNTLELNEWLKEIGLKEEVVSKLEAWKNDGTLNKILNEKLFKELDAKIAKLDEMAVSNDQKIKKNENTLVDLQTRLTEAEKGSTLNRQSIIELKGKEAEFERRITATEEGSTTNANLINELKEKDADIIDMINAKANPTGKGIITNTEDWNNYSADGIYRVDNYTTGPNGPKGASGFGVLTVANTGANAFSQTYVAGSGSQTTEIWTRLFHTGHWSNWTKLGLEAMVEPDLPSPEAPSQPRPTGRKFLVDAGHSLSGPGAGASGNGIREEIATRSVKDALIKKMKAAGHTVIDCTVDHANSEAEQLKGIVAKANQHSDAEMFISIHFNSYNGNAYGTECYSYFSTGKAADFSKKLTANVSKELGTFNRGAKTANFYVLKNTTMPAVLLETLFLTNKEDVNKFNPIKVADAIMKSL